MSRLCHSRSLVSPLVLLLALILVAAPSAAAQTTAELAEQRASLERRLKASRTHLEEVLNMARAEPDDSLLLHGAVVRYSAANLNTRERKSLTRAFNVAAEELQTLFGPDGSSLLAGQVWQVTVRRQRTIQRELRLGLDAIDGRRRTTEASLTLPLRIERVVHLVHVRAGRQFLRMQPHVYQWSGGLNLDDPTATYYFAHRQLALHQSSPANRCARGSISSCADIFNPAARDRWFDPSDVVNTERDPTSGAVRSSLVRYAIEMNGPGMLRAFQTPADSSRDRIQFIAAAVGQQPDELLRGWQARLATSGAVRVQPLPRSVAAALGWFAICGLIATRRRPQ